MQPTFPHVIIPGHPIEPPQHLPTPPKPTAQEAFDIGKKIGECEDKMKTITAGVASNLNGFRNDLKTWKGNIQTNLQDFKQGLADHKKNVADTPCADDV